MQSIAPRLDLPRAAGGELMLPFGLPPAAKRQVTHPAGFACVAPAETT